MTTLLRIFSGLFGYDYKVVVQQPTVSKQKIVTLGTLILIPVTLWVFSGYYLSYYMMEAGFIVSMAVALVLGGIILIVDRSFVATPKTERGGMLKAIRFGFALVSTVLGSLAIDMVLFSGDMDEFRQAKSADQEELYIEEYRQKHSGEVDRLFAEKQAAMQRRDQMVGSYFGELDGSLGTGKYEAGKVATAKEKIMEQSEAELQKLEQAYADAVVGLELKSEEYAAEKAGKRGDALLSKVRDLHEFVLSDGFTLAFYLFFFAFVLMLEAFFLLYKSAVADTIYERFLQVEEEFGHQKLEEYRDRKARLAKEKHLLGRDYEQVQKLLDVNAKRRYM